ncbi:MAG: XisH family protein [Anaerolineales bacterium]|nr:XisH family protein [Anaerolineales bacterium]
MPAKDKYHLAVRVALEKEGWVITHDPLYVRFLDKELWIDLAAERVIAAEKQGQKIAIEIKSFLGSSVLSEFHEALGQFINYRAVLLEKEPERVLYLAVPVDTFDAFFNAPFGEFAIRSFQLRLLVYRASRQEIVQWIE